MLVNSLFEMASQGGLYYTDCYGSGKEEGE